MNSIAVARDGTVYTLARVPRRLCSAVRANKIAPMPRSFSGLVDNGLTRRDCARALLAGTAARVLANPNAAREIVLQNERIRLSLAVESGKLAARNFTDRINGSAIVLPAGDFELEFEGGQTIGPAGMTLRNAAQTGNQVDLLYVANTPAVEARVRYTLPSRAAYLRKQISVRCARMARPLRIMRADLDNWRGVRRNWSSMRADSLPYGSHPIFCDHVWAGVEFVAAFNRYDGDGFVLRSRPGGVRIRPEWTDLHSTVAGVAVRGGARDAFLRYIEDIRLAPPRWVACYNSWWTLPLLVKQDDYLALMRDLKRNLFDRHGVFFDIVATDAGWNDPQSIWQIDRANLPHGFDDMRAIVESAKGRPGLWISPGEEYAPNFDYEWGKQHGYAVLENPEPEKAGGWSKGVSIADPRYREQTKAQLRALIRENGFGHIKYDGLVAYESTGHDDLLPGQDSVEPIAEHSLELLRVSKEANPDLVTEPTYFNSFANYISPWMIRYSDTLWANAGGDCPLAFTPAPDYREAHTTAREYFIFTSLDEVWLPQNALQYFDIVHCDDEPGFANHAAMAVGRGRFFLSTYLNPKYMTEDDWRIYAGLLKWARRNQDILRNTKVLRSRVEAGEPYAYAHWLGTRGIVAVRNPSNETRRYTLDLHESGAPGSLSDAVCYTQYPYRAGIAEGLNGSGRIELWLAPWELVFLEILPAADLKETVVIGARWFGGAGNILVTPLPNSAPVVLVEPGGRKRKLTVRVPNAEPLSGTLISKSVRPVAKSEWLENKGAPVPSVALEMECSVSVPAGSRGTVLFLVEFPGRRHQPSRASVVVNGFEVETRQKTSAGHVGYYMPTETSPWKDTMKHEAEWTWYIADLPHGDSTVRFTGKAGHGSARTGAWVWCERDLRAAAAGIEGTAGEPLMPQYQDHLERKGVCIHNPRTGL